MRGRLRDVGGDVARVHVAPLVRRRVGGHRRLRGDPTRRLLEDAPNDARYFIGFVGWQPGELDAEIARGFWFVMISRASRLPGSAAYATGVRPDYNNTIP